MRIIFSIHCARNILLTNTFPAHRCGFQAAVQAEAGRRQRREASEAREAHDEDAEEDEGDEDDDAEGALPLLHLLRQLVRNASTQTLMRLQAVAPDNMIASAVLLDQPTPTPAHLSPSVRLLLRFQVLRARLVC